MKKLVIAILLGLAVVSGGAASMILTAHHAAAGRCPDGGNNC